MEIDSKKIEQSPDASGWLEVPKLNVKCENGKIFRYPPMKDRPLRRRLWKRKLIPIQSEMLESNLTITDSAEDSGSLKLISKKTFSSGLSENAQVLKEREKEIVKLSQDFQDVQESMTELSQIIKDQGHSLLAASQDIKSTKEVSKSALEELQKADKMSSQSNCLLQ